MADGGELDAVDEEVAALAGADVDGLADPDPTTAGSVAGSASSAEHPATPSANMNAVMAAAILTSGT